MLNNALISELAKCWKGLVDNLIEVGKLYIVYVDDVNIVDAQSIHALEYTLTGTGSGVVPCVDAIHSVTSHLSREVIFVTVYLTQCLAKYCLCLVVTVVWGYIDEIDAIVDSSEDCIDSLILIYIVENSAE